MALSIKASKIGSEDFKLFIEKNKQFLNEQEKFVDELTDSWITKYKATSRSSNKLIQKQKELIDLAKFAFCYDREIKIQNALCESPDFAISLRDELIGIELTDMVIIDSEKQKEGILNKLFTQVTKELKAFGDKYNGLYAFDFITEINLNREGISIIKSEIINIVQGNISSSNIVTYFHKLAHNDAYIYQAQASMIGPLYRNQIENLIKKKEGKIVNYITKGFQKNWLLIVAGGVTPSENYSDIEKVALDEPYVTDFNKIFFMNFFKSEFFELKTMRQLIQKNNL